MKTKEDDFFLYTLSSLVTLEFFSDSVTLNHVLYKVLGLLFTQTITPSSNTTPRPTATKA